jgi:hypothetical protein
LTTHHAVKKKKKKREREKTTVISKRETSGKRKVRKSTLTGQHEAELKQGKDGWDVTLNASTGDGKVAIRAGMKPLLMH